MKQRVTRSNLLKLALLVSLGTASISATAANLSVTVKDHNGIPVDNAVVYIEAPRVSNSEAPLTAVMDQRRREFAPYVLVVKTDTTISFPNHDRVQHHVYSFSPSKSFNLKLYSGETAKSIEFDKAGPIALGCNIHDWMIGFIYVVDSDYYTISNSAGSGEIEQVPEGEFLVRVWHPRLAGNENQHQQRVLISDLDNDVSFKIKLKQDFGLPSPTNDDAAVVYDDF